MRVVYPNEWDQLKWNDEPGDFAKIKFGAIYYVDPRGGSICR